MPSLITFKSDERTDKAIKYIMEKLGVKGKNKSELWRNLLVNTHEYIVKAESEKENLQPPVNVNTDEPNTPKCNYLAFTEKGVWYCETKKIEKEVCLQQWKRYIAMKLRCRPLHKKRPRTPTYREKPARTKVTSKMVQCPTYKQERTIQARALVYPSYKIRMVFA